MLTMLTTAACLLCCVDHCVDDAMQLVCYVVLTTVLTMLTNAACLLCCVDHCVDDVDHCVDDVDQCTWCVMWCRPLC